MPYLEALVARIKAKDQWPNFDRPYFLGELNTIADEAYESHNIHGYLAALLVYHQLIEEMLRILLEYSEFFVQLNLAPIEIHFPVPEKAMFGRLIEAAKSSMEFRNKAELIALAQSINRERNKLVHELTKQEEAQEIGRRVQKVKAHFEEFYGKFSEAQDWFLSCFNDLQKNKDWDELLLNK